MQLQDSPIVTPTPTAWPTHHFIPTRTPTPFISVIGTPPPPTSSVGNITIKASSGIESAIWGLLILAASIASATISAISKRRDGKA
ncbi:MAG: hypothetical protein JXR84_15220 [Anaerolineae bacterium]|nr:hypothetical protein [Anaerolineae bacterium]